jgi:hypothetical protein
MQKFNVMLTVHFDITQQLKPTKALCWFYLLSDKMQKFALPGRKHKSATRNTRREKLNYIQLIIAYATCFGD